MTSPREERAQSFLIRFLVTNDTKKQRGDVDCPAIISFTQLAKWAQHSAVTWLSLYGFLSLSSEIIRPHKDIATKKEIASQGSRVCLFPSGGPINRPRLQASAAANLRSRLKRTRNARNENVTTGNSLVEIIFHEKIPNCRRFVPPFRNFIVSKVSRGESQSNAQLNSPPSAPSPSPFCD